MELKLNIKPTKGDKVRVIKAMPHAGYAYGSQHFVDFVLDGMVAVTDSRFVRIPIQNLVVEGAEKMTMRKVQLLLDGLQLLNDQYKEAKNKFVEYLNDSNKVQDKQVWGTAIEGVDNGLKEIEELRVMVKNIIVED